LFIARDQCLLNFTYRFKLQVDFFQLAIPIVSVAAVRWVIAGAVRSAKMGTISSNYSVTVRQQLIHHVV
jgi:hypothetical protein